MVASLAPAQLLPLLLPYADAHKNPKVRGKAGHVVADAAARMAHADVAAFGLPRLLQAAGKLVTGERQGWVEGARWDWQLLQSGSMPLARRYRQQPAGLLQHSSCAGLVLALPVCLAQASLPLRCPCILTAEDNTPEAREAAKRLIDLLRLAAADPAVAAQLAVEPPAAAPSDPAGEGDAEREPAPQPTQWELLCRAHLSSSAALAVLKASAEVAA